jgi:hypothetical protein
VPSTIWQLSEASLSADLTGGGLAARVDIAQPQRGVHDIRISGDACPAVIFAVDAPWQMPVPPPLEEQYVRGGDLIATYAETAAGPVRMQMYWRFLSPGADEDVIGGLEWVISVQTSLLDSQPAVSVRSTFGAAELWHSGEPNLQTLERVRADQENAACCVARWPDRSYSYVEIAHPDNDGTGFAAAGAGGHGEIVRTLFRRPLEKGVILRSRLRGWFVLRQEDFAVAARCFHEFADSPIPLTV